MADVYIHNIHESDFGDKVYLKAPYEARDPIMSLSWDKTHRRWNEDKNEWELDFDGILKLVEKLRLAGFSVEMDEEVRELYRTMTADKKDSDVSLTVIINNQTAYIPDSDANSYLDKTLYTEFSYKIKGAEKTDAYQDGNWDGKEHLYDKHNHAVPVGLKDRLIETLSTEGYDIIVKDMREEPQNYKELELEWNFESDLREYQFEAVEKALSKQDGVLSLPTGSGKTVIALKLIQELGLKTIILVHKRDLLYQWRDKIEDVLGFKDVGVIGDDQIDENDITVGMLQTLNSKGTNILETDYDMLIADEVHRTPADSYYTVVNSLNCYHTFGLSATPYRTDNKELKIFAGVGEITIDITAEEMIDEGYLAEPRFSAIRWTPGYDVPEDDYERQREMIRESTTRTQAIIDRVKELEDEGHNTLIDVKRIEHGEEIADGLSAPFVHGETETEERERIKEEFKHGDVSTIVSTLLDEGVDLPQMTAVVLADSGKSSVQLIQTIGRALRPLNGEKALIIDMDDREAGKYMIDHTFTRQRIMRNYYGKYYEQNSEFDWDDV